MKWHELRKDMKIIPSNLSHLTDNLRFRTEEILRKRGYLIVETYEPGFDGEPAVVLDDGNYYQPEDLEPFDKFRPKIVSLKLDTQEKMALFLSLFSDKNIVEALDRKQGGKVYGKEALKRAFIYLVSQDELVELSERLENAKE